VVVVSLGLSVWAVVSAQSLRTESERMVARTKALQRKILQGGRTPQAIAALSPPERAWYAKETSPSAVIVLEALSRALPDTAHLTELRFENATLLIAPLQQSGHLADVRFFAPTTRGSDGTLFRFHIEGRIEPRLKIAED
jgi:general secretion pathway protein L